MISFSDALNTVSGFWRFLAPFINIVNGAAVNSLISDDTGVIFITIVRPEEFIIKVLVIGLIIILSSFIHSNPIITGFNKAGTT